jgi:hypothetical protein
MDPPLTAPVLGPRGLTDAFGALSFYNTQETQETHWWMLMLDT